MYDPKGIDIDRLHKQVYRDPNNPLDRLRMIFDRKWVQINNWFIFSIYFKSLNLFCSESGTISPELNSIYTIGFGGMFVGGIYGGILQAKIANWNFRETNEATLYDSSLAAKRMLQNETTVGFAKGAFRWGWRCGVFCLAFR